MSTRNFSRFASQAQNIIRKLCSVNMQRRWSPPFGRNTQREHPDDCIAQRLNYFSSEMPIGKYRVCGGECHTGNEPPQSDRQTVLGCSRVVDGQTKIWRGIGREHIGKDSERHAGKHSSQIEARRQKRRLILAPGTQRSHSEQPR